MATPSDCVSAAVDLVKHLVADEGVHVGVRIPADRKPGDRVIQLNVFPGFETAPGVLPVTVVAKVYAPSDGECSTLCNRVAALARDWCADDGAVAVTAVRPGRVSADSDDPHLFRWEFGFQFVFISPKGR